MLTPPPLPLSRHPDFLNKLLVGYIRSPDHKGKLRVIRLLTSLFRRKRLICETKYRFQMTVDDTDLIQRSILHSGDWEPEISRLFWNELGAEDVFYDIGANVGFNTCLALAKGVNCTVSFDPDPTNGEIFKANIDLNGFHAEQVNFIPKAVSDKAGLFSFQRAPSANMGIGSLTKHYQPDLLQVEVVTLDELSISSGLPGPTVMKIDVEGWENEVLNGARSTLQKHRPRLILFEADCDVFGRISAPCLISSLTQLGYFVERIGHFDTKANYAARPVAK